MANLKKYLKLVEDNRDLIEDKLREAYRNAFESHGLGTGWGFSVYFDSNDEVSVSSPMSSNECFASECREIKSFDCVNPIDLVEDIVTDAGELDSYPTTWDNLDYDEKVEYIVKKTGYIEDLIDSFVAEYEPEHDIEEFIKDIKMRMNF